VSVREDTRRGCWIADYYDGTGRRRAPTFATKREATDHLATIRGKVRKGTYCDPRQVPLHSLRHTFASALIMQGAPVTEVAKILGHASPATTLKCYAHWFDGLQSDAVARLGELFGKGAAAPVAANSSRTQRRGRRRGAD
jgi:integrase